MAYTPVPEAIDGQTAPSADWWNTYIRDNMAAMFPEAATAKGQLLVATGVDAATPVAAGADGTILTANSAATAGVSWVGPAAVSAYTYGTVSQNVLNATWTQITQFDGEILDAAGNFASNTFTATHTGVHFASATLLFGDVAVSDLVINESVTVAFYVNDELYSKIGAYFSPVAGPAEGTMYFAVNGADLIYLTRGQAVKVYVYQDFGDTLLFTDAGAADEFNCFKVVPII